MKHIDNLERIIGSLRGKKILDVGAGKGDFLMACVERGYGAVGIELNPDKIKIAREKSSVIQIIEGVAEHMPFADTSFDFINVGEVIEHVRDPKMVLQEIYRVLKPGGKVYISVHNRFGIYDTHFHVYFLGWLPRLLANPYLSLFGKHKNYRGSVDLQNIREMHYYTFSGFKKLAKQKGFLVSDIRELKIRRYRGLKKLTTLISYPLLRVIYFSTFHFLLEKHLQEINVEEKFDSIVKEKSAGNYEYHRWFKTPILRAGFDMTKKYMEEIILPFVGKYTKYIELGPGPGTWTKLFLGQNKEAEYQVVDISEEMLNLSRNNLKEFENIKYVHSDFMNFQPESKADFFLSSRVIEYIQDKEGFASKLSQIIEAGGRGAIITKAPHYHRTLARRRLGALHQGQIHPKHLKHLLLKNGFAVEDIHCVTVNFPILRSAFVNKIVSRFCTGKSMNWFRGIFSESYGVIFKKKW